MKYNYDKKDNKYLTPPELVKMGLQILSLEKGSGFLSSFDLDTCCSDKNVPAEKYYLSNEHNGLIEPWEEYNWCNPPYDECPKWVAKAYNEQLRGKTSILLIPVRTETSYWHKFILFNDNVKIFWLRKRFRFLNAETKKPMGIFKNALALVLFRGVKNEVK